MAHGTKRIVGGKILLVVGVVLGAVMAASCYRTWVFGSPTLLFGLRNGVVDLLVIRPADKDFISFVRWMYDQEPRRITWWLDLPDHDVNAGVFAYHRINRAPIGTVGFMSILLWTPSLLAFVAGAASWLFGYVVSRRWKNSNHVCPTCNYARVGLPENAPCPECGRASGS